MSMNDLKKELISLIEKTDDEELLSLLKEDIVFYGKASDVDVTDRLTEKQIAELKALAEEDDLKDTISLEKFRQATQQWRTK